MNDVAELKNFVVAHTSSQGLPPEHHEPLLRRVEHDGDGTPGSWVAEWSAEGDRLRVEGRWLPACVSYTMARFPYVDGAARQAATDDLRTAFDRWREAYPQIERLDVDTPQGRIRCWTTGLDATVRRPLLLMTGGIISVKEQWAPVLLQLGALGLAGVVTEMPGVGENTLRYAADSWRMYPAILDAVGGRADTARTYALALSFSGHLALRAALHDDRIRGVVGAGMPVHHFFTDAAWQSRVPRITADTLTHLTGAPPGGLHPYLKDFALEPAELAAVRIPVAHVTSLRDEIIPAADVRLLRERVARIRLLAHDDVHGSPRHFAQTRLWTLLSVLRMLGGWAEPRLTLSREFARLRYGTWR